MDMQKWNDNLFEGLRLVNRNLNMEGVPAKAAEMLYDMECCLCSGDGLSRRSAFRASSLSVVDRVLGMIDMRDKMECSYVDGDILRIRMRTNLYGINNLYFSVKDNL